MGTSAIGPRSLAGTCTSSDLQVEVLLRRAAERTLYYEAAGTDQLGDCGLYANS